MKKFYLLLCSTILFCLNVFSQKMPIQLNWLNSAPSYLNGGSFSAQGVTNLSDGSVVVVGYFQHTVDFDPGPDTFNLTTTAYYGIFVAKYTNQGKLAFAYGFSESNPLFFDENFESANAVTADADDNIYVTGSFRGTVDFDPDSDKAVLSTGGVSGNNFIACYTKNGKLKFAKDITKGTGEFVESYSIALDKQKNIYVTGVFQGSSVDFDPGPDSTKFSAVEDDIFFAKYDSAGNYIFAKTLGGDKNDEVGKIAVDSKKNILICGGFASGSVDFDPGIAKHILKRNGSKEEMFFAKYDSMGNYVFAKNVGNYQTNFANSIAVDKNDGFVLTGYFYGTNVDFDINNPGTHLLTSNGTNDIFVARYNSSGSCVFAFNIGNAGGGDNGLDIAFDSNQNIICTGAYGGSNVDFDPSDKVYKIKSAKSNNYYIAEYNYNGNFLSAVGLNGGVYADDFQVICLHVTIANKILVGGFYKDSFDADAGPDSTILTAPAATMFVAKYDNEENFLGVIHGDNYYDYTFPYINVSSSAIDKKGNIYVCGHFEGSFDFDPGKNKHILASTENIYGSESQNSFFAKYDKNGNLIFAKGITGGDNFANDIAVDNKENIYLTGLCDGFTDFDPDSNVYFLNKSDTAQPYKYYNYFIAKYDVNGNLVYAKGDGNGLSIFFKVSSIALDTKSNICIAGVLDKSIDFDPGPNKHILNGGDGLGNMFIAKYDSAGNYAFAYCIKSSNSRGGINDLKFDNKNNIIVTGTFSGTNVDFNPGPNNFLLSSGNIYDEGFISKYKNDGSFINAIDIDGQDYSYSNFSHLTTDSLNNIYIAGSSTKAADFDPGPDSAHLTQAHETFFASYNNKLQFRFLKGLEGLENYNSYTEQNSLNSIVLDKNNNIYVAGQFTSAYIDCDAGPDTALLRNKNLYGNVLFLAKYDTVGNYIYSFEFTGDSAQGNNSSAAIMVDTDGKIDYTGTFKVKINFGLGTKKQYAIPTTNHGDIFIAQYKPALAQSAIATAQNASREINDNTVKIYPNPITDKINIQLNNIEQNNSTAIISLYDVNGKCLKTNEAAIINHNLNSSIILPQNLISGNYFIEIKIGEKRYFSDALVK